jgi:hypothetical protein
MNLLSLDLQFYHNLIILTDLSMFIDSVNYKDQFKKTILKAQSIYSCLIVGPLIGMEF